MVLKTIFKTARREEEQTLESLFRDLYTRVLLNTGLEGGSVVGVTSAIAGEGKTTIASRFATTIAADGVFTQSEHQQERILLIECNRGEALGREFEVPETPGLLNHLRHECSLDEAIRQTSTPRLSILPLGGPAHYFPILVRSAAMPSVLAHLREQFAMVILDLPPILATTDTHVLVELADRMILVIRSGVTSMRLARQALEEIDARKLLGVVLNDRKSDLPDWLDHRL